MNNNIIDVAFIAAKLASIKDEKARMMVGGAWIRKDKALFHPHQPLQVSYRKW